MRHEMSGSGAGRSPVPGRTIRLRRKSVTVVRWFRSIAAAAGLALVLAGCAMDGPRSIMRPAGDVAQIQLDLFMFTFWLSVVVLVLVGAALIYALVRFRSRPSDKGIPKQVHGSVLIEAIWTTLPVIIII